MKTVVGMFDTFGEAQNAVQDLVNFGVRREDISLVARDEHGSASESREVGASGAAEGATAGAVGGSVVGGALGLLIGAGLLVIPGIGPVLAAGPLAAAIGSAAAAVGATAIGAGLGAAAGGLLGSLMGAGIAEEDARAYVEGVRRGGTLVSVHAADTDADDVREIFIRNGAVNMDTRSAEWRTSGWDATGADAAIDSNRDAYVADAEAGIPRGDSYSIRGRDYDAEHGRAGAEADAAGKDWQDSTKLGTVGGSLAGAATGAAIGAAGGPVGSVVGGIAGAATGAGVGAAGDVAGERAEPALGRDADEARAGRGGPGAYDFHDDQDLAGTERKVVDSSFTDVDRTGERVKGSRGFASGHSQPIDANPAQFDEFATHGEGNFRTDQDTTAGAGRPASDSDTMSESTRRAPHFAGTSDQPGGRRGPRIYDQPSRQPDLDTARAGHEEVTPAHGDFARGQREDPAPAAEPDYARGVHDDERAAGEAHLGHTHTDSDPALPHHGDYARGQRHEASPLEPDYARGQRRYEVYDGDFVNHYQSMTGSGGQPYDYYKPGYQFGFDMANDESYSHASWEAAERDARQRWERDARGSWEEFKQTIRYGWEKARGRA